MDIHEILALDKASRQKLTNAREEADAITRQTPEKIGQLRAREEQKLEDLCHTFQKEQTALVEQQVGQIEGQMKEHLAGLDDVYKQNKDRWIAHIVEQVTEV
ncbi:MAG: hypothetical protein IKM39_03745 [Clostridia bacterium]|nr:hypothetical protein [Clostridia bacterium]